MSKPTVILGISAFYHDSAAALLVDGQIVAAAQEERFTRKKHDPAFPSQAIQYVLEESGYLLNDISAVSFYDKPLLKFERLLETYHIFSPLGLTSFLSAIPVWIKEKLFLKKLIKDELKKIGSFTGKLYFPEHHLSHAASAFYPSPFEKAGILTLDGVGEWATTTIGKGENNSISLIKEIQFPHSLGLLYSAFTYYCGFKVNSGEYKLMGLAPYGDPTSIQTKTFKQKIEETLIDIREDGSFLLNMPYFNYATGLTMTKNKKWNKLFNLSKRQSESELSQDYMNLALAIQQVTEEIVIKLAKTTKMITGCDHLVLAGGVALNCVANGKLLKEKIFKSIWIQPAAGDAGGALGAAQAVWHISLNKPRTMTDTSNKKDAKNSSLSSNKYTDSMNGSYLGPSFSNETVEKMANRLQASFSQDNNFGTLCNKIADYLDSGQIVGWFQGRMEFGPRALGRRSILADPRKADMQKKLNLKIKYREGFRPFAPAILASDLKEYFEIEQESPYMLLVAPVHKKRLTPLPDNYQKLSLYERLYHTRSEIQSITHVDNSARIQTVHEETNPEFSELLEAFKAKTGCPILINTSFNVRGEPIVCTPEDAYRCFMRTEMDVLVINNCVFIKSNQPSWDDESIWREEFILD
ncbi:carbamoyltransferase [bacterium]|jgi:carbamoyltransferase|nr:carbamoyltransferase [bacterium]